MLIVQLRNIRTSKLHSPFFFSLQKKTQYTAAILLYKERAEGSAIAARRGKTYNGREFLYVEFVFEVAWA